MRGFRSVTEQCEYIGEMYGDDSEQYGTPCVVAMHDSRGVDIVAYARKIGAIFHEDGPEDECFVVQLRHEIGPELWTEKALLRSRP